MIITVILYVIKYDTIVNAIYDISYCCFLQYTEMLDKT